MIKYRKPKRKLFPKRKKIQCLYRNFSKTGGFNNGALAFWKEKNKQEKPIEQSIVENIAKDASPENAVITYILLQSQKNGISLAKKEDITYISFRNKEISDFLKEWYTLLQLHQHKRLSDKMYEIFIQSQLAENKITEDKEKLSDGVEDFVDF